jgi:hypothetical protein
MLTSFGAEVPQVEDESAAWPVVLRAFGFCDLPLGDFFGPFLSRLPAWDEQDGLERSLNLLLGELDHAGRAVEVEVGPAQPGGLAAAQP